MTIDFSGLPPRPAPFMPRWLIQDKMPEWKRELARSMRRRPTPAEAALWAMLRSRGRKAGMDIRWKHQQPMFGYIADFWCASKKLVVELDGGYHSDEAQRRYDAHRDAALRKHGIRTLRFENEQVLFDMDSVIESIAQAVR